MEPKLFGEPEPEPYLKISTPAFSTEESDSAGWQRDCERRRDVERKGRVRDITHEKEKRQDVERNTERETREKKRVKVKERVGKGMLRTEKAQ